MDDDIFEGLISHVDTPADKLRYIRWENQQRYKQHQAILAGFRGLCTYLSDDMARIIGIDKQALHNARTLYTHERIQASKTFTVCPTCYEALRSRTPRKISKSTATPYNCNICDKPNHYNQNRKIHHTTTLSEANNYVRSTYPELFV